MHIWPIYGLYLWVGLRRIYALRYGVNMECRAYGPRLRVRIYGLRLGFTYIRPYIWFTIKGPDIWGLRLRGPYIHIRPDMWGCDTGGSHVWLTNKALYVVLFACLYMGPISIFGRIYGGYD